MDQESIYMKRHFEDLSTKQLNLQEERRGKPFHTLFNVCFEHFLASQQWGDDVKGSVEDISFARTFFKTTIVFIRNSTVVEDQRPGEEREPCRSRFALCVATCLGSKSIEFCVSF